MQRREVNKCCWKNDSHRLASAGLHKPSVCNNYNVCKHSKAKHSKTRYASSGCEPSLPVLFLPENCQFYSVFCHKCDGTCSDLGVFFIMLRKFFFILRLLNSFYPESKLPFLKALIVLFYLFFPFLKWLYRFPFGLLVQWIINFLDVKPGLHYWDKLQWSYYYPF